MLVVGTATAVGVTLANDRSRSSRTTPLTLRLAPAFVPATPQPRADFDIAAKLGALGSPREYLARRLAIAALFTLAVMAAVGSIPALGAFASSLRLPASSSAATSATTSYEMQGPDYEQTWAVSHGVGIDPRVEQLKAIGATEHEWSVIKALLTISDERQASENGETSANAEVPATAPVGQPYTMAAASGYAPGTVLRARITIYGCTGPGGGFCDNMASGGTAFQGAAACSNDLAFGTRLTIAGDQTGRVYECLDRGSLPPTWIDVYFGDTSDGLAWQSSLGGTVASIQIVN